MYDEALDSHHIHDNNVVAFKCTTSHAVVGNYTVALDPEEVPGLENMSIAACSKLQTRQTKIGKVICELPSLCTQRYIKSMNPL